YAYVYHKTVLFEASLTWAKITCSSVLLVSLLFLPSVSAQSSLPTSSGEQAQSGLEHRRSQDTWLKTYDRTMGDIFLSVQQTSDGGFIAAGNTLLQPGGYGFESWLLRLNRQGIVMWLNTYDSGGVSSVAQTSDGGFIAAGDTGSFDGRHSQAWILRLDRNGGVVWENTYGASLDDVALSARQVSDGGFVVAGQTCSFGFGNCDGWLLRLSEEGKVLWETAYGAGVFRSIEQISDGGFIVAGGSQSFTNYNNSFDAWVLRLDGAGNVLWSKTYGLYGVFETFSVKQTSDGGFVVSGDTISGLFACQRAWLLKLDGDGNVVWQHAYDDNIPVECNDAAFSVL